MRYLRISIIYLIVFLNGQLLAAVYDTKHNLSITNKVLPGTYNDTNTTANPLGAIKSQGEVEECVFCHTPHSTRPEGKPLWNRSIKDTQYTMYNSDYLKRMGYAVEANLGSLNNTPGALSRQCLSCHDGTIAIGSVFKLRQDFTNGSVIATSGTEGGMMPSNANGYIGTDLRVHHPVGIKYDPTITKVFSDETRTMELKPTLDPDAQVRLFDYGTGTLYVECSSCHDPHTSNNKFLHVTTGTNHGQNIRNTCTSCHMKDNWTGSVHQAPPTDALDYTDIKVSDNFKTSKIADLGCANCHTPHNAQSTAYLNRKVDAKTCYEGAASGTTGAACHASGGAKDKDIKSIVDRQYGHPVANSVENELHTNLDVLYGTGVTPDAGAGIDWATNQHATCVDCHNPHQARKGTHVANAATWYGATGTLPTNLISASGALTGATGIRPIWPANNWVQPQAVEILNTADKEYEICMKCHSYWGVGNSTYGESSFTSKSGVMLTDVAMEININNRSGHPVVMSANTRTLAADNTQVGSYAPRALDPLQLLEPWKSFAGTSTMYCSDCHGSETEAPGAADPKGPHGSTRRYLLKGANQYWPTKDDGFTLYDMDDIGVVGNGLFCANCHDLDYPHTKWKSTMAGRGFTCVTCHVAVPHGSPVSRLIGYKSFPAPYDYNNSSLMIEEYKKTDLDPFDQVDQAGNIWAGTSCSSGGAGPGGGNGCHGTNVVGFDSVPANMIQP